MKNKKIERRVKNARFVGIGQFDRHWLMLLNSGIHFKQGITLPKYSKAYNFEN